jgi:urea carboxylase
VLLVIESMKMEFSLLAPTAATVHKLLCEKGASVAAGQTVVVLLEKQALESVNTPLAHATA